MSFSGFPMESFQFLAELTANNEKRWFEANRNRYEAYYLRPALAFIEAIGPRLQTDLPGGVHFEPRVNGSLFRVNRDVRFSKDKTPYKNHIDMWFWLGERKGWQSPGYYMRLLPDEAVLGAGMHSFSKPALEAFRRAVIDEEQGSALQKIIETVEDGGYTVMGADRKTLPKGYDKDYPRARFLLFESLNANLEGELPQEVASPAFVDYCLRHFKTLSAVNDWLSGAIKEADTA